MNLIWNDCLEFINLMWIDCLELIISLELIAWNWLSELNRLFERKKRMNHWVSTCNRNGGKWLLLGGFSFMDHLFGISSLHEVSRAWSARGCGNFCTNAKATNRLNKSDVGIQFHCLWGYVAISCISMWRLSQSFWLQNLPKNSCWGRLKCCKRYWKYPWRHKARLPGKYFLECSQMMRFRRILISSKKPGGWILVPNLVALPEYDLRPSCGLFTRVAYKKCLNESDTLTCCRLYLNILFAISESGFEELCFNL